MSAPPMRRVCAACLLHLCCDDLSIERNFIFHAMLGLHDGAGIYIYDAGEDVLIRGNFVRDIIDTGGYRAAAYYLDELCRGVLVEDNLLLGVVRALNCHIGDQNLIRNNVFISSRDMELQFPRCVDQHMEHNVVSAGGTISIHPFNAITGAHGNILFSAPGKIRAQVTPVTGDVPTEYNLSVAPPLVSGDSWTLADPKMVNFRQGRVTFSADSPAEMLGIHAIDVSDAGVERTPANP